MSNASVPTPRHLKLRQPQPHHVVELSPAPRYCPEYISRWSNGGSEQLQLEKQENEKVERWGKRATLIGDFCKVPLPPAPLLLLSRSRAFLHRTSLCVSYSASAECNFVAGDLSVDAFVFRAAGLRGR